MNVLLYYLYVPVPDPAAEVRAQRELCARLNLKGRILISVDGINGTCCGDEANIEEYKKAMEAHPLFAGTVFKESPSETQVFPKLQVRVRPELVTLRTTVDLTKRAGYITPDELHAALERGDELVLMDMRNDYESAIGRFRNAFCVPMRTFRDLPDLLAQLAPYRSSPIVTYCTGGIRCETATALLTQNGFENVRQLEGGIVTYCEKYPDGFFEGACFVFDDRMAIRYESKGKERILTTCSYCGAPCDRYLDCSILPCNKLFLCCDACETLHQGRCGDAERHAATLSPALAHAAR